MNNFERLQSMSIEDLAKWLDENGQFDTAPWTIWFDQKYCKNCPDVKCRYEDGEREFTCAWCEVNDGCKFLPDAKEMPDNFEVIKMWLEADTEDIK